MDLDSAIQHLKESLADPTHKWGCEECKQEHEQLLEWLEDYKRLQSVSSWISCSDMMPKKDGEYLCVSNGEFKILPYRNGEFYSICFDAVLRCCNSSVTHWMPLPSMDGKK